MFDRLTTNQELLLFKSIFWLLKQIELAYPQGKQAYAAVIGCIDAESSVQLMLHGLCGYYEFDAIFRAAGRESRLWISFEEPRYV